MNHKILIIVLLIVAALCVFGALAYRHIQNSVMDKDGMVTENNLSQCPVRTCGYSYGGDDIGSSESILLEITDENTLLMTVTTCKGNGFKEETRVFNPPDRLMTEVAKLIDYYGAADWGELEDRDEFALDAGTATVYFTGAGGEETVISGTKKLPEGKEDFIRRMHSLLLTGEVSQKR